MWYVYILKCFDDTFYTGITTDLDRRVKEHNSGKGAKYTRGRGPVKILEFVQVENKSAALKLESLVKKQAKDKKIEKLKEGKK